MAVETGTTPRKEGRKDNTKEGRKKGRLTEERKTYACMHACRYTKHQPIESRVRQVAFFAKPCKPNWRDPHRREREREREREKEETQDQSGQTDETMDMSFHPHTFIHSFVHHDNIPHTHLLFVRSFSHTGANTIKDACNQSACLHTLMQITYRKEEKENHRGGNEASFLGRHVLLSGKRERKVVPPCFPSPTRQIERNPTRDTRPDNHPTEKTPSIASPQEHPTSFMHLLIVSQRSNQSVLPKSSPLFSPCTDLPGQTGQLRKELLPRWHATSVVVENSAFRVLPPE
mmetsp:Transcript_46664/g.92121  ORF Transcript_46664/g.92121 Transcript_46664/m.92121 type:complete len:288 (-) Transcript_46664:668-1531(-)